MLFKRSLFPRLAECKNFDVRMRFTFTQETVHCFHSFDEKYSCGLAIISLALFSLLSPRSTAHRESSRNFGFFPQLKTLITHSHHIK